MDLRSRPTTIETVVQVLSPYLGVHMARAAVNAHAERMGLGKRPPTADELEELFEELHRGLAVFVGRTKAEEVLAAARAALKRREGGS